MKTIKNLIMASALLMFSTNSFAAIVGVTSYTGTFGFDDAIVTGSFQLTEQSSVTARTFSYAGGTQADGNVVAAGGFDPILALYRLSDGQLLAQNDDGPGVAADPVTGSRFDSVISNIVLNAGIYFVAISQFASFPNGSTFADGYSGSGTSNFIDVNGNQRTANYAFDVTVSTVPVPAAGILFASALFGAGLLGRRKKKASKSDVAGAFARAA